MRLVKTRAKRLSDEQVADLMTVVKSAEKRDQIFFSRFDYLANWAEGQQWSKADLDADSSLLTVNLAHAHVTATVPTLFFKSPTVKAYPLNEAQWISAQAWEDILNAYLERSDYKVQTDKVVHDSVVFPEGWKKWVVFKNADPEILSGEQNMPDNEETYGGLAELDQGGPQIWHDKFTAVGLRLSGDCIITDCPNRTIENSRFIAVKYKKLLSELAADPRYNTRRHKILEEVARRKQYVTSSPTLGVDDEFSALSTQEDTIDVYEVWIYQIVNLKLYKQVITVMDNDVLIRGPLSWSEFLGPFAITYPFNKIELNPVPNRKPLSELETWMRLQKALNWIISKLVKYIDNRKQIYEVHKANLAGNPDEALNLLESGRVRVFVPVKEPGKGTIVPVSQQGSAQEDWQLVQLLQALIQQVSGLGQNRRGSAGVRTATEASIIEQGTQIRTDKKIDVVAEFIKRDVEYIIRLARAFVDKETVFRITGNTGSIKFQRFTPEDAAWSPDVVVEPESFRKAVNNERLAAYTQALQAGQMVAQVYGPSIRLDVILRRMLEEMGIPNPQEITQDDVPAEVKQMAEIMQIMVGIGAEVLPTDNHQAEAATLMSFMQSEVFNELDSQMQAELAQHLELHEQAMQEMQQQLGQSATAETNTFDRVMRNGNPASEARQETQGDRTPLGGQF